MLDDVLDKLPKFKSDEIIKSFIKGYSILNSPLYKNVVCSISGGADSDIMLDIMTRIDVDKKVTYVWFDTGVEYKATKEHIKYLEEKYGIEIVRRKALKPIPVCCREYCQPFLSKNISEYIERLQTHGFQWEDEPFDVLLEKYPNCKVALRWWCNDFGDGESRFDIARSKFLKEFMISCPPWFKISNKCCNYAKKKVAKEFIKERKFDLNVYGVRKSEGGARSTIYKNCYTQDCDSKIDEYRPLFWFSDADKNEYNDKFGIKNSDCYEKYGLTRTGCVGCPYSQHLNVELEAAKIYEPNLYKMCCNVFEDSYRYTKMYKEYRNTMKKKMLRQDSDHENKQLSLFDFI